MAWATTNLERSYACNPNLIVQLRKTRSWTQEDFAHASGYTARLIRKAESGSPISNETISDLADALATDSQPVYPEDLISDPVHLARQFLAGWYIHQTKIVEKTRHFLDDDILLHVIGDPATIPFAGKYRGLVELQRFFDMFYSLLEVPPDHDHEPDFTFVGNGNEVSVTGMTWIHPIGMPLESPINTHNLVRFRRGKIYEFIDLVDTQKGAAALEQAKEEKK